MRILVTGSNGQLGTEVMDLLVAQDHHEVLGLDLPEHDLTDRDHVLGVVTSFEPDLILHGAAFTAVDLCEEQVETAYRVNCAATRFVADGARRVGAHVVYVSTDYVFDGSKGSPYTEDDATNPLNVYGRTKLAGEAHARGVPGHLVVRTQGLFGREGKSFVRSILQAAIAGRAISVVDDVTTGVTYADDLARAIRLLVESGATGTYHVANEGGVVWADFARAILDEASRGDVPVARIPAAQTGRAARRPPFSVLDTRRYAATVGSPLPSWRDALRRHLKDPAIRAGG